MHQSKSWSRQTGKALKGNHRRRYCIGRCVSGVMGNTHGTPSLRRGAITTQYNFMSRVIARLFSDIMDYG